MDLQRVVGHLSWLFPRPGFWPGPSRTYRGSRIHRTGRRRMQQRAGCREPDGHVGQHPLQPLELGDRASELRPLGRVSQRLFIRALGDPQRHRAGAHTLGVVGIYQPGKARRPPFRRQSNRCGISNRPMPPAPNLEPRPRPGVNRRTARAARLRAPRWQDAQ